MVKRATFALGVLIAVLAIWLTLINQGQNEAISVAVAPAGTYSETAIEPPEDSVAEPEPSPAEEQVLGEVEQDSADSCAEMSRLTQSAGLRVGFAPGVTADEDACEWAVRFATGARMPALPGLTGFDVPDILPTPAHTLANESDDPTWARQMEGQLLSEFSNLLDFPISSVHAVCRSSTCGLVFSYSSTDHSEQNYNYYAQQLADTLGFSGYFGGVHRPPSGNWYMTLYMGDWETDRPDPEAPVRTAPRSLEEALERARNSERE